MGGAIRVLMVEDNRATCALLRAFFEEAPGLELCGEAHDGREGLALLHTLWPDLLLLDLVMPGMDGMEVLAALKEHPPLKRPKVLVLSGVGSDEYVQRCIRLGADYYLMKPVRLEELGARICELFPNREEEPLPAAAWLLLRLGADRSCLGFGFACRAVELLQAAQAGVQMKEIYLQIAEEQGTSYSCVEKNLRTTVAKIHAADTTEYREGLGLASYTARPGNGAFLRALACKLNG